MPQRSYRHGEEFWLRFSTLLWAISLLNGFLKSLNNGENDAPKWPKSQGQKATNYLLTSEEMMAQKEIIRLYRFFNFIKDEYGKPFGLCDRHKRTYSVPAICVMEKLAESSSLPCFLCETQGSN